MFETLIAFHARRNPQAVILRTDSQTYTYAQFDRAIESIAAALEKRAWPRGAVALIRHHNPAVRWWLALALERLGVVFAFTGGDLDTRISIIKPDLVITDARPDRPRTEVAVLVADDAWVRDALDRKGRPTAARSQAPHDLVTLVTSSGSTGTPKVIPLSREVIDRRIAIFNLLQPDQSRALATVGEETSVGLFTPLGVWRQGGAVLMTARIDADLLRLWRPSILWVSPSHLNMMTSKFPAVFTELPDMVVEATGGAVGPALAARMENLKGARLTIAYGSTEASVLAHGPGSLLARHPGAAGYVVPWAEVQIVGPEGDILLPGTGGEVRLRSTCMVDGYLDDPETTAEKFKDGWFHPGDYGRLTPDGLLLIEGRIDDVINIGGVKLSAARMEETALECQGVQDAAAAVFPMASGRWAVHFAIVPTADFNPAQLKAAISSTYGVPPVVTILDAIPRNSMQKVQRDRLREAILEKARPSAGETAGG